MRRSHWSSDLGVCNHINCPVRHQGGKNAYFGGDNRPCAKASPRPTVSRSFFAIPETVLSVSLLKVRNIRWRPEFQYH